MLTDSSSQILKKVKRIEIATRRQVAESISGAYKSVFKGQGMDFEESREYQFGDEIRSIDWPVTARTGKAHVKKYREERELTMMLAVDLSASSNFGSTQQSKKDMQAELAAVLAFSAVANGDKVGLMLFTDEAELIIPPKKGRTHVLRLIREILYFEAKSKGTNISKALDSVNRLLKRHSIVVLISDFLQGPNGELPSPELLNKDSVLNALSLTNKRHDLICMNVYDEREIYLPKCGTVILEDAETGENIEIDTLDEQTLFDYQTENESRLKNFKKGLTRIGIDSLELKTGQAYIVALCKFFERRKAR